MPEVSIPVSKTDTISLHEFKQTEGRGNFADCPRIASDGKTLSAGKHLSQLDRHVVACDHLQRGNTCDRLQADCPVNCAKGIIGKNIYKLLVFPPGEIEVRD